MCIFSDIHLANAITTGLTTRRVQRLVLDFEEAMWRAAAVVLPGVELKGCAFHFTQALWRHIQENGLQRAYTTDDGTYKFLRRVMALSYLPAQNIPGVFRRLERECTNAAITLFLGYVRRTWINSYVWSPATWSVYKLSIRTNNDLEGWHNRLNRLGRPNMNFYMLVTLLYDGSCLARTQVRLVSDDKLTRLQNKAARTTQSKIHKLWTQYEEGARTLYSFSKLRHGCSDPRPPEHSNPEHSNPPGLV